MSRARTPTERALLVGTLLWMIGYGAIAWFGAWRQAGEQYAIDDTGARAITDAVYEERKALREFVGTTPQTTPEGVRYVVMNISLPKFRADTQRH